ncbi:putative methyltransferase [Actinacidiphila reveromycinica]|uniref:Putative methyltransferase n=1 Tax=Actinacidiphila reveromycinica TaxID=659352 RepID=A0A7U3VMH2_9ACTN|nr:class I SAM-dependent methyltransferase [Streptomyces sp. SN-593]BBA96589.1 putative methyltransferase [Streptomyces sp. SN-593]
MADDTAGGSRTEPLDKFSPDMIATFASSFGPAAAAYSRHRPDYPVNAVRWALQPALDAGLGADDRTLDVLDLGAGTGKLSAVTAGLGHRVTAVEPDARMLAELREYAPGVSALQGGAEEIPLPDGSVDAVLVGQAFHWFDPDRALPEIARVLRPGGALGALWNTDDDRVDWVAGLGRSLSSRLGFLTWSKERTIVSHPALFPVEEGYFPHVQRRSAESLVATIATHSHALTREPAERDELFGRVRSYLASRPETAQGEFDLPLITVVQRSVRRGIAGS